MKYLIIVTACDRCGQIHYGGDGAESPDATTHQWGWQEVPYETDLCNVDCLPSVEALSIRELLEISRPVPVAKKRAKAKAAKAAKAEPQVLAIDGSTRHPSGVCPHGCRDGKFYIRLDSHMRMKHPEEEAA